MAPETVTETHQPGAVTVSAAPAIEIESVSKRFGRHLSTRVRHPLRRIRLAAPGGSTIALRDVTARVSSERVTGLLGPNGAGKTTLLSVIMGFVFADAGTVRVRGIPVSGRIPPQTGALIERPTFYPFLTAEQNLVSLALASGIRRARAVQEASRVLQVVGLEADAHRRVRGFSTGMRQRLGVAGALIARPSLVILDEPASGLDPAGIVDVRTLIARLPQEGVTALVSSHLLNEMEQVCDDVILLAHGSIIAAGPVAELTERPREWEIRFQDPAEAQRAIALLRSAYEAGTATDPRVVIARPGAAPGRDRTPIRVLVDAGLEPMEIKERRPTLEQAFFALTGYRAPDSSVTSTTEQAE